MGSDSCNRTASEGCAQSSSNTAVDEDTDNNGKDYTEQDEEEDGETNCQSQVHWGIKYYN